MRLIHEHRADLLLIGAWVLVAVVAAMAGGR